jgi:hypothetical protein
VRDFQDERGTRPPLSGRTEGRAKDREPSSNLLHTIAAALDLHGLTLRGGFNFAPGEEAPVGLSGAPAKAVLLVGQLGREAWAPFQAWRAKQPPGLPNPLDTWSRAVIGEAAKQVGARAVGPNDKPYQPFQRWAMRAEGLKPSPLGILMHPAYGLWHAYRGALLFDRAIPIEAPREAIHLCDLCVGKPCLNACPVGAYSVEGFAYADCQSHLKTREGQACMSAGCFARNACPVGAGFRYSAEQQAFHMQSFARP